MDMDTNYPGLPIRKYVQPVEDMELVSKAPKVQARGVRSELHCTSLSSFGRPPLELRQEIYRHLGIPIARGPVIIFLYTFAHWDANLATPKGYRYAGSTFDMYHPPCNSLPEVHTTMKS
jgi:hypothetical protein